MSDAAISEAPGSLSVLRALPSVDQLLRGAGVQQLIATQGRNAVRDRLRDALDELRRELIEPNSAPAPFPDQSALVAELERRLGARLARDRQTLTQRVINATGVVLHTNLGRAPLSPAALEAINKAAGYCNLEYDLATGGRGGRGAGVENLLRELTGCAAAVVVNNCAAAVLLVINTLAEGGEVVISRGELVEIGGSFRIPDVIAKSGARLREVGTTNRTRIGDYATAINDQTRLILRAHPSNYRIVGFTEKPALHALAALAKEHSLPLFEDLGSGCLLEPRVLGLRDEPTVQDSVQAGASIVAFSGDKLLGGPQAGIIIGQADLIARVKANPLMRALRADKLVYAALEATLLAYAQGRAVDELPTLRTLQISKEQIAARAAAFVARAQSLGLELSLMDGSSAVGGGCAPEVELPTTLIVVGNSTSGAVCRAEALEERLRRGSPPVIARIVANRLALDLRTVPIEQEEELARALKQAIDHIVSSSAVGP